MADISMCEGTHCPKKESCYRFKATPNPYRQAYIHFVWSNEEKRIIKRGECKYFYPISE